MAPKAQSLQKSSIINNMNICRCKDTGSKKEIQCQQTLLYKDKEFCFSTGSSTGQEIP